MVSFFPTPLGYKASSNFVDLTSNADWTIMSPLPTPSPSFWERLDLSLTLTLRRLLRGTGNATLWILGLLSYAALPLVGMEYYDGMLQSTWVEWAYVVLLPLLLWRHIAYCKRFNTGFWVGFNRLLKFSGLFVVIWSAAAGLLVTTFLETDMLFDVLGALVQSLDVSGDLFTYGTSLLVVYMSAPNATHTPAPTTSP